MTNRTLLLQTIFGKYRGRITVTYIVTLAENMFELSYPSLTGLAVNGLLKHDFTGLWLLLGVWLAHTATSERDFTASLRKMCSRCVSTVLTPTTNSSATSRLERPSATSRAISCSRRVSG